MTFKHANLVEETSITTGTGTYTLDGAPSGRQTFAAGVGANNYCSYSVKDSASGNWEVGIGQVLSGPARLTRDKILASSNAGAAVNWSTGTRTLRGVAAAELAAPRVTTKSVAGSSDVTLTQDEQRCDILVLTGALTGNISVIVDATPWPFIVYNNTSGAFTLTFKVSGQTGKVIPQGARKAVHCDGTDVRESHQEFASGTRMLFQQTSAPTGWTKESSATYNDAALRIVTGTVGTGGADAFSTHFGTGKSTANFTLTTSEIPGHTHDFSGNGVVTTTAGAAFYQGAPPDPNLQTAISATGSTGGGGAHSHTLNNFNIKYADTIIAQKD